MDNPFYLRVREIINKTVWYWKWPTNLLGRPVTTAKANALFQEALLTGSPSVTQTIPEGGLEPTLAETEGLQGVTNEGNQTSDWLQADKGYAMGSFPIHTTPKRVAVIADAGLPYYNQGQVIRELLGGMNGQEFADFLRPYLNANTPGDGGGPTVANAIPDQTISAAGDQTFTFAANTFTGTGLSYVATKEDGSQLPFTLNSLTRTFLFPAALANQSVKVKVVATDQSGKSTPTTFTVTIARTVEVPPYILTVVRKFDPSIQTMYYLVLSSYTGNELSKLPVGRWRAQTETAWRSDFADLVSTEGQFAAPYNTGYTYDYANIGPAGTTSIFQVKPYPTAPDSTILTFQYTQGATTPDFGTTVYTYNAGSANIQELYVERYIDSDPRLACYASGSGELRLNLVAKPGTPAYANGLLVMTTQDGPYANPNLFTGKKPYGALFRNVPNGSYTLSIIDSAGNGLSYDIVLTNSSPVTGLKISDGTPGPPPPGGSTGGTDSTGYTKAGIEVSNKDILDISIQWFGGKARVVHNNKPSSGSYIYVLSGQPEITALPTSYDFNPGDELVLDFIKDQTTTANFYDYPVDPTKRAQAVIVFGQPPA